MSQISRVQGAIARAEQSLKVAGSDWRITGMEVDRDTYRDIVAEGRQLPTVNGIGTQPQGAGSQQVVLIDGVRITRREVPITPAQIAAGADAIKAHGPVDAERMAQIVYRAMRDAEGA